MNSITGTNKWCGPSAISAIAGVDTDTVVRMVQTVRGNHRPVISMFLSEIIEVLKRLGFRTERIQFSENSTIFFWLVTPHPDGVYVILIPHHFIAIEINGKNKFICDNHTKEPINTMGSARLMQQIKAVVKVTKGD